MPVITIRQPATAANNHFEIQYDVFDVSGNRAQCSFDFHAEGTLLYLAHVQMDTTFFPFSFDNSLCMFMLSSLFSSSTNTHTHTHTHTHTQ